MGLGSENRYGMNNRLRTAYQGSLMSGAVSAAKSGNDSKEGRKNLQNWLNKSLPKKKGKWEVSKDDVYDLRESNDNPKRGWQLQHDILSGIHSEQDDFKLKTNRKNEWMSDMFEKKGFGMNAPFAGSTAAGSPIYHNNMAASSPIGTPTSIFNLPTSGTPGAHPGGIMNTGSFYDLAINPVVGRERQGFGLGGYTVMS